MTKERQNEHRLFDDSWTRKWEINRLVLMVRDPTRLFAYWEVDDLRKKLVSDHFQAEWDNLPFYLRLHDVSDLVFNGYNSHSVRPTKVHSQCDNWYLSDLRPGRSYVTDFGTTTWKGEFFALLRSNVIQTPPLPMYDMAPQVRFAPVHHSPADREEVQREESKSQKPLQRGAPALVLAQTLHWPFEQEFDGYRLGSQTGRGN